MSGLLGNPDVAVWALFAGIMLVYFECNRPGLVTPGCVGGLMILLAGYSLWRFGLTPAGMVTCGAACALILLGICSNGRHALAGGGVAMLIYGLRTLIQPSNGAHVHLLTALVVGVWFGLSTSWLGAVAVRARRNKRGRGLPKRAASATVEAEVPRALGSTG